MTAFTKRINKEIEYFLSCKYLLDNYNQVIKNKFSEITFSYYETNESCNNYNFQVTGKKYIIFVYHNSILIYKLLANSSYPSNHIMFCIIEELMIILGIYQS